MSVLFWIAALLALALTLYLFVALFYPEKLQ